MKLIFLDRDGVINKDTQGYVASCEEFEFVPGSLEAIVKLNANGYEINVISNQAGIAKGIYSVKDLKKVNNKMMREVEKAGGKINSAQYCVHEDEDNCLCRKPATGMFKKAVKGRDIEFMRCYFIGDKISDITAGRRIGCKTILVLSGKTKREDVACWKIKPDYIKENLKESVDWILDKEKK